MNEGSPEQLTQTEQENVIKTATEIEHRVKELQPQQKTDASNVVMDNTTKIPEPLQLEQQASSPIHAAPSVSAGTYVTPPMSPTLDKISDPTIEGFHN